MCPRNDPAEPLAALLETIYGNPIFFHMRHEPHSVFQQILEHRPDITTARRLVEMPLYVVEVRHPRTLTPLLSIISDKLVGFEIVRPFNGFGQRDRSHPEDRGLDQNCRA